MANRCGFQFGLVLMIMVAMTGLIGFVIIYHYASFERPMQHFAIVIDAGSTQTRSNLFTIDLDVENLVEWTNGIDDDDENDDNERKQQHLPLTKLFQVKQLASCTNGAPLASLQSADEAQGLVDKCLREFGAKIKRLDMGGGERNHRGVCDKDIDKDDHHPEEVASFMGSRVDSVTFLYLGATAGMRALRELNETRAIERIDWIDRAINVSSAMQTIAEGQPAINKGFVGVISGSDEASFGWVSVNFLCETLEARHPPRSLEPETTTTTNTLEKAAIVYKMDGDAVKVTDRKNTKTTNDNNHHHQSVGTLELGGTSAQMAFQVDEFDNHQSSLDDIMSSINGGQNSSSKSFQLEQLELFNGKYNLATRSDLCLGMSQAILRANFIILRNFFNATAQQEIQGSPWDESNSTSLSSQHHLVELTNPCLQNSSQTYLNGTKLIEFLESPCLVEPSHIRDNFKGSMYSRGNNLTISFAGTGDTQQCSKLLTNLIEPHLCSRYFSLCPENKNQLPPPAGMPFVTISGYNHALMALTHLTRAKSLEMQTKSTSLNSTDLEMVIGQKLGGHSIDHALFLEETSKFCSLDAQSLIQTYHIDEHYYKVQCLQLVYINKLLTEFYQFDPKTSWKQIKFLLSPPETQVNNQLPPTTTECQDQSPKKGLVDIGWTLGLLLNATSHQFDESSSTTSASAFNSSTLFYHHGTSVIFILKATLILMFACILLAICFIVTAVVSVRHQQRKAYISPTETPRSSVQSSWCSSVDQMV